MKKDIIQALSTLNEVWYLFSRKYFFEANTIELIIVIKINKDIQKILKLLKKSKKPLVIIGNGVKQSNTVDILKITL